MLEKPPFMSGCLVSQVMNRVQGLGSVVYLFHVGGLLSCCLCLGSYTTVTTTPLRPTLSPKPMVLDQWTQLIMHLRKPKP